MRYLLLPLIVLLVSAPAAFAQEKDYGDWEFYIGYAHERANNGADRLDARGARILPSGATARVDFVSERLPHQGVMGEVVANVHRNWGLVTNFSGTWANVEFFDRLSGQTYDSNLARYTLLFGPRFNARNSTPVIPFAHALFGVTRYHSGFKSNNSRFSCPDRTETAFAMGLGAGLDIKLNSRFDIRPIQVDYLPVFFDHGREDGVRFSAGLKIKAGN